MVNETLIVIQKAPPPPPSASNDISISRHSLACHFVSFLKVYAALVKRGRHFIFQRFNREREART